MGSQIFQHGNQIFRKLCLRPGNEGNLDLMSEETSATDPQDLLRSEERARNYIGADSCLVKRSISAGNPNASEHKKKFADWVENIQTGSFASDANGAPLDIDALMP